MIKKLVVCSIGLYINFIILFFGINTQLKTSELNTELEREYKTGSRQAFKIPSLFYGGQRHLFVGNDSFVDRVRISSSDSYFQILKNCYHGKIGKHCPRTCWNRNFENSGSIKDVNITTEKVVPKCSLSTLTDNCDAYKKIHGFNNIKISKEEKTIPIAFAIKSHLFPEQTERLLRTIYREHNVYCIHIDTRADNDVIEVFNKIGKCLKNVVVLQDRLSLIHASYSHVLTEMKCMQAMRKSTVSWKYYINLSEQDFPLKTNLEMVKILNIFDGLNDIETYDHPVYENWRLENKFSVHKNSIAEDSPKSPSKYSMRFSKGNPHGIFSKQFVDFIFQDDVAIEITQWLNNTYSPAENIWATLVTLPWAPGGYPVTVRHMISTYMSRAMIVSGDTPRCHGKFESATCIFSCSDIWWLQNRPEFFATKFDSQYDEQVLDCLESWYRGKTAITNRLQINWPLYFNLPHMKYHRLNKYSIASQEQREEIKKEWLLKYIRSA